MTVPAARRVYEFFHGPLENQGEVGEKTAESAQKTEKNGEEAQEIARNS